MGKAHVIHCSNCHNETAWEVVETSKRASLYFVPVAKWARHYFLACPICDCGVELNGREEAQDVLLEALEGKSSLLGTVMSRSGAGGDSQRFISAEDFSIRWAHILKRTAALAILADGDADGAKTRRAVHTFKYSEDEIQQEMALAKQDTKTLGQYITEIAPHLTNDKRELILKTAFYVAATGGNLGEEEKRLLDQVVTSLGMSAERAEEVIVKFAEEFEEE